MFNFFLKQLRYLSNQATQPFLALIDKSLHDQAFRIRVQRLVKHLIVVAPLTYANVRSMHAHVYQTSFLTLPSYRLG